MTNSVKLSFSVSTENYSVHCGQLRCATGQVFLQVACWTSSYFPSDGILPYGLSVSRNGLLASFCGWL